MIQIQVADKQEKNFVAHIEDTFTLARENYLPKFTSFLDLRQVSLAKQVCQQLGNEDFLFWAGHPDGERLMLGVFPPYSQPMEEEFPLAAVTIRFRESDALGHRDLLGSLMALRIRREAIGDILIEPGLAVVFLLETAIPVVLEELRKVGRCGVRTEKGLPDKLPALHKFQELEFNISAPRLDCVAAALSGASREKVSQMIKGQLVSLDGAVCQDPSKQVPEDTVISIRGTGKFVYLGIQRETKKGRLQILCKKYI